MKYHQQNLFVASLIACLSNLDCLTGTEHIHCRSLTVWYLKQLITLTK